MRRSSRRFGRGRLASSCAWPSGWTPTSPPPRNAWSAAHPEVEWLSGRPIPTSLDQARTLRGELWEARRGVYQAAAEGLREAVTAAGGRVAYVSTSAPLVFVDLPAAGAEALAQRPEVMSLGLEQGWRTFMASAGVTVGANWTGGSGDQGNGVRVAVVEYANASTSGDLAGQVKKRYSTNGNIVTHIHPTWVAGAIASRSSTWRGVAPGADIVSAGTGNSAPGLSTDRAVIAATDWAVSPGGGDADIVNTSFGQDTATGAEGRAATSTPSAGRTTGSSWRRAATSHLRQLERRLARDGLQRADGGRYQ